MRNDGLHRRLFFPLYGKVWKRRNSGQMSEIVKLLYRDPRLANEFSEQTWTEFFMLWNGQSVFIAGFNHHHMGTALSRDRPSGTSKFLNRLGP